MPTMWTVLPSQVSGAIRLVTTAFTFTDPRFSQPAPAAIFDRLLGGKLLGDLDEELRLQRGVDLGVLGPKVEVLGQRLRGQPA